MDNLGLGLQSGASHSSASNVTVITSLLSFLIFQGCACVSVCVTKNESNITWLSRSLPFLFLPLPLLPPSLPSIFLYVKPRQLISNWCQPRAKRKAFTIREARLSWPTRSLLLPGLYMLEWQKHEERAATHVWRRWDSGFGVRVPDWPNTASSLQLLLVRRWEQNSWNCLLKPTQALAQCELGQTPVGRIHKQSCHPLPALPQERRLPQRDRIRSLHNCVIVGTWELVKWKEKKSKRTSRWRVCIQSDLKSNCVRDCKAPKFAKLPVIGELRWCVNYAISRERAASCVSQLEYHHSLKN